MTDWADTGADERPDDQGTGLGEFVDELMGLDGVLNAAVFDRSGRVLAAGGFTDRNLVMEVASLTAGLNATGGRLGEVVGDAGPSRTIIQAADRMALIAPLPVRAGDSLVLLVSIRGETLDSLGPRLKEIVQTTAARARASGSVDDPREFEDSLLESLDRLFPKGQSGGEGSPGAAREDLPR